MGSNQPIDISSTDSESSDWDLEQYKDYYDSASSKPNSRVLPAFASSSGTSYAGQHGSQRVHPPTRKPAINGHSSHSNNYVDDEVQILPGSSSAFGNPKRGLPSSLQPLFSSSSRPSVPVKSQTREIYGQQYANAWQNRGKAHLEDGFNRVGNDMINNHHHGNRVLPSSLRPHVPVPTSQYAGPPDLYRAAPTPDLYRSSGAANEPAGDERLIYQVALQDLNQPATEAELPDGLLSVSLLRHQVIYSLNYK
ncbi:uncharacterized protein LOC143578149, partial [Bidens hawaiensis]|uniref:uncharacterized protein LOC143578149 n=1 Tax=Bidens hawaiensis TaxID=980011 RepID=UPI00404A0BEC